MLDEGFIGIWWIRLNGDHGKVEVSDCFDDYT
jgi:hypothetical protein